MDLESALREFEACDANVQRLSNVWDEMAEIVPAGITFITGSPEERRYETGHVPDTTWTGSATPVS